MVCPEGLKPAELIPFFCLRSRGALAAATRGAPVAPQRPAPEVLSHFRRVRRKLRLAEMTILGVGMACAARTAYPTEKLAEIQRLLAEHHEIMDDM